MKRTSIFLFLLVLFSGQSGFSSLLENGDFEQPGVTPWQSQGTLETVRDADVVKEGKASLRLVSDAQTPRASALQKSAALKPGERFELKGEVRTRDAGRALIEITFLDREGRPLEAIQSGEAVSGTTFEETWVALMLEGRVPAGAADAAVRLVVEKGGTAWFDGIELLGKDEKTAQERVVRPPSLREADFTALVGTTGREKAPDPALWTYRQKEAYGDGGALLTLGGKGLLRLRQHLPEAMAEFRLAFKGNPDGGIGFGFRSGYARRPRISLSFEGRAGMLYPIVEDEVGRRLSFDPVPVDDQEHHYTFVREKGAAIIRMDGKEIARASLEGMTFGPVPVSVYNESPRAGVVIGAVAVSMTPEDLGNLAAFQPPMPQFRKVAYRETNQLPAEAVAAAQNGLIIYQRPFMEHLFSNSVPRKEELAAVLRARATPGEREPILAGVYATGAVPEVSVQVGELTGPGGAVIPASAVSVQVVREILKRHLYNARWSLDYSSLPMVLEPFRPFALEANRSKGVFLDIHVPESAAPGIYKGTVSFTTQEGTVSRPMEVEVYPFRLVRPSEMFFGAYAGMLTETPEAPVESYLREMAENGFTTIGYASPWGRIRREAGGGEIKATFIPTYEKVMSHYEAYGFTRPVIHLQDLPQSFANREAGWGKPGYDEAYLAGAKALHEELLSRKGWPEVYLQPVDEPAWRSKDEEKKNVHLLRLLKEQGLFKTEQDGPPNHYFIHEAGPYADMWVVNGEIPPPEVIRNARAEGKKVLIYNTDVETWRPVITRYSAGFFQWKFDLDGCLQWEFQNQRGADFAQRAYDEISEGGIGYMALVYPAYGDSPGGPTLSLRGFREGIDDYAYLLTLRHALDAAREKKPQKVAEIEAKLQGLMESLKPLLRLRNQGAWSAKGEDGEGAYLSGSFNLDNGWSLGDYDRYRHEVAQWIIQLGDDE
ncbi:MAG TPA: hypothetical protein VNQ90_11245 [Chthoniobacteraceae bacterium]|nr:hypothetical protein [Chthoniobacteraceae bacterium]